MNHFSTWPIYSEDEMQAVTAVLRSGKVNYWTGQEARQFEKEWAAFIGTDYAIAMANGTVTLEAALYALDIREGDEVITTPRTFIASSSAIVLSGATPVFADIDLDSQNITAETIKQQITAKTKAILVVHLAGWAADMDPIMALAKEHGLVVIEDCAQAHGAEYKGQKVGSIGHIGSFSFCRDKIISTGGEGGMVTTNDKNLWEKLWSYKDHGKDYDTVYKKDHPPGFRWLHQSFGTNARMTEMQAAIGRCQLKKLPAWLEIRECNAMILEGYLKDLSVLRLTKPPSDIKHAYYRYYAFVKGQVNLRDQIMQKIEEKGIPAYSGSCSEIYLETAFVKNHLSPNTRLPIARQLGETSLMFLTDPSLSEEMMHEIGRGVRDAMLTLVES